MKFHPSSLLLFRLVFLIFGVSLFWSSNLWAISEGTQRLEKKLIFLGDSITEGYGVSKSRSYPELLAKKLQAAEVSSAPLSKGDGKISSEVKKNKWKIINSSVAGSTTASALGRLKWVQKMNPDLIFIALGANDGLRGIKAEETQKNLSEAIEYLQTQKIKVILAGMMMPPNYGKGFTEEFKKIFPTLSQKYKIPLMPFLLKDIAGEAKLNQEDGIHPNEKGHEILANNVFEFLKEYLR